jgi:DNA mismatch repair protein MutS2
VIERERDKVSRQLKETLDAQVRRAQEEIATVIRNLQRRGTAQEAEVARRRIVRLRERVEEALPAAAQEAAPIDWSRMFPGARVRLARFGAEGELIEGPNAAGQAQVLVGGKRMVVPAADLQPGSAPPAAPVRKPAAPPGRVAAPAPREDPRSSLNSLDVRGMRAEEAQAKLVYFLDKLYGAGEATAYVIHGHGTGALKTTLRAYLGDCPYVTTFRSAEPHRGGDGVTVIELRQ